MSGTTKRKITVVYVASTGHVLAGFTQSDASGPAPKINDLVGDNLVLHLGPTPPPAASPTNPVGRFLIPATDLALIDVDLPHLPSALWGQSMTMTGPTGSQVLGQPPSLFVPKAFSTTPAATHPPHNSQ